MNKGETNDLACVFSWLPGRTAFGDLPAYSRVITSARRLAERSVAAGTHLDPEQVVADFPAAPSDAAARAQIAILQDAVLAAVDLLVGPFTAGAGDRQSEDLHELARQIRRFPREVRTAPTRAVLRDCVWSAVHAGWPFDSPNEAASAIWQQVQGVLTRAAVGLEER
ncbi:hypothetical protein [Spirillospora sp. CA-294931]|uniref:hypothetical protein n=1 Tax=Spirillospora sp. CA-294931 TaxID=3240042 RepID=UPI003D935B4D